MRLRLLISLAAVLALSLGVAATLACLEAVASVRTELTAALAVGARAASSLIAERAPDSDTAPQLGGLLATFDGNRHLRAALLDDAGHELGASRMLAPDAPPPRWFVWLVDPNLPEQRVPAGAFTLVLRGDPANEAGEVWARFADDAVGLGVFCALAALLTLTTVTRALRPLALLSAAFPRLAAGAWDTRVAERGPPELIRLTHGFNEMAARLAAAEAQNRRLQAQLQSLQEEERAEVARDLHDEIGPQLFAAQLAAAAIRAGGERAGNAALAQDAAGLQDVIAHIQREVRGMLRRLRPSPAADLGLAEAIASLTEFWQRRQVGTAIRLDIALDTEPDGAVAEALYRCVQEGLANALRHGRPSAIEVFVRAGPDGLLARVADDGTGDSGPGSGSGLGLLGMRERVAALGGSVEAGAAAQGGWVVTARLPAVAAVAA